MRVLPWLVLLVGWNAAAQPRRPELPPAVRPIVESARSAAPEFFADVIVRLVETGRIPGRELQVDLLTEAFGAATRAQQPYRWIAIPGSPGDNHPFYIARGSELKLDALSLERQILKALVTVDPPKARELFQSVQHPSLDPRPCEDPLIADVSAYYEIAGELAQSAFTSDEKGKGQHAQFLLVALSGAHSPNEMAAFARSLGSVVWTPAQFELLLASLGAKLQSLAPDYRPFALSLGALQQELEGLARQAQAVGVSTDPLVQGVRAYLVTQLKGPRCAEDLADPASEVAWFNGEFRGALAPITDEEMKPSKRGGAVKVDAFYTSSDEKRIADEFRRLRSTTSSGLRGIDARSNPEWRRQLADLLREASSWQPSGADIDAFNQKANVYLGLYQQAPPGEDRDRILATYLRFLQSANAEHQHPAEWLWQVKLLVTSAGPDAQKVAQAFQFSGDLGLNLYWVMSPGP